VQRELVRAYQAAGELERALAVVRQLEQALALQLEVERQQRVEHLKLTLQLGHAREHAETLSRENEALRMRSSQLSRLSLEDALTGLGNRRFFDTRLTDLCDRVARRGGRLSLAIADIDAFKAINDTFSYGVGDKVLQTVAGILRRSSRDRDMAVRWGGEEFVLAFVDTPLPEAMVVAERLREAVAEFPWHTIDPGLEVTMSVGLAGDLAGHGLLALHAAADRYLKAAKRDGKNRLVAGPVPP
jgi:diguanylate cyclase (GGDEF)-like protein